MIQKSVRALTLFLLISTSLCQKMERFWWEKAKGVKVNSDNFHKIIGKGKYVLLDVYARNCPYCYKLMKHYNKVYDYFAKRDDVVIAKMNGNENDKLADLLDIESYPTMVFFAPFDTKFPIKYQFQSTYNDIKGFVEAHSSPAEGLTAQKKPQKKLSKLCKKYTEKKVKQSLDKYYVQMKSDGLVLTSKKKKYYKKLEDQVNVMAKQLKKQSKSDGKDSKKIQEEKQKIEAELLKLKKEKEESDNSQGSVEAQNELRKKMLMDTNNRFKKILENLESKIDDIQGTMNTHDLVKLKREEQPRASSGEEYDLGKDEGEGKKGETEAQEDNNTFPYSWLLKYGIVYMTGAACMALYQRLNSLDNVVKVVKGI